jgi:DNA helicase HerA-like ATPase
VTLQGLAESFSAEGVPVFLADVKGDLSGIAMAGSPTFAHADALQQRAKDVGLSDYTYADNPAVFWDLYGEKGHPVRTTVSEMGPLLLARLMDLNETQEGVLNVVFRYADEQGLLLLDLADLQSMLAYTAEHASELTIKYGNVTKQTVGTIQRQPGLVREIAGERSAARPPRGVGGFEHRQDVLGPPRHEQLARVLEQLRFARAVLARVVEQDEGAGFGHRMRSSP